MRAALFALFALSACGGEAFTIGDPTSEIPTLAVPSGDAGRLPLADGGSEESATTRSGEAGAADDPHIEAPTSPDAGAGAQDAGTSHEPDAAQGGDADPIVEAAAPPDVGTVRQACTTPASCPSCGVYPREPCCSGGYCGCDIGGAGVCVP